ncbi:MAG: hypothetical protein ABSC34_05595 [Acidimicrobiales bacterium]
MIDVAVVTCAPGDVDPDSPVLLEALTRVGLSSELVVWDDERVDWANFNLTVIRSTWDYTSRRRPFLDWAASLPHLENPYPVLEYSSDKHYLADLARRGHHVVPSFFIDVGDEVTLPGGDVVVKPCVGAGSMDAARYGPEHHDAAREHVTLLHRGGRDALVQPYVPSVDVLGERGLIFVDGQFCHAMKKGAMLNTPPPERHRLFRREQMTACEADPAALAAARHLLEDLGYDHLLYARVDVVSGDEGWLIMELELVEPSLYLSYDEGTTRRLAEAIRSRVARR